MRAFSAKHVQRFNFYGLVGAGTATGGTEVGPTGVGPTVMGAPVAGVTVSNSAPAASTTVRSCRVVPAKFNVTLGSEAADGMVKASLLVVGWPESMTTTAEPLRSVLPEPSQI